MLIYSLKYDTLYLEKIIVEIVDRFHLSEGSFVDSFLLGVYIMVTLGFPSFVHNYLYYI